MLLSRKSCLELKTYEVRLHQLLLRHLEQSYTIRMPGVFRVKILPESFFEAIEENDAATITRFLSKGIDLNAKRAYGSNYGTPLTAAVATANFSTVVNLIVHGANVNQPGNAWGVAPLHVAVKLGNFKVAELLIDSGADVNVKDRGGVTPLIIAGECGDLAITSYLLENGAFVNHQAGFEVVPPDIRKLLNDKDDLTEVERDDIVDPYKQNTALTKATAFGHLDIVKELLAHHCDVTTQTANGNTALHIAAREGHVDILRILMDHFKSYEEKNSLGETPLFLAVRKFFQTSNCRLPHLLTVRELICARCDASTKNNEQHNLVFTILTSNFVNTGAEDEIMRMTLLRKVLAATRTMSYLDLPDSEKISSQILDSYGNPLPWLTARAKSPRSLQHQCRLKTWEILSEAHPTKINDLPITNVMVAYLNLY